MHVVSRSVGIVGLALVGAALSFVGHADPVLAAETAGEAGSPPLAVQSAGEMGFVVAPAGDVNDDGHGDVIVGASSYGDSGSAAFVYLGSEEGIETSPDARLDVPGAEISSVASAGDVDDDGYDDVVIGSEVYSDGETLEGHAWIFHGSSSGIDDGGPADADAVIQGERDNAGLGYAVTSGDFNDDGYSDIAVGGTSWSDGENTEGAVFVFHGSDSGLTAGGPADADAALQSNTEYAAFGWSVAAGDVNGDGNDDLVVGAGSYSDTEQSEGAVFVFESDGDGVDTSDSEPAAPWGNLADADTTILGGAEFASLGETVAADGDVNDDGYDDVVVGQPTFADQESDEGAVLVFQGSSTGIADGLPGDATAVFQSNQEGAELGEHVAYGGDLIGDGRDDIVAGATAFERPSNGQTEEGAVFVFPGDSVDANTGAGDSAVRLVGGQSEADLGAGVGSAGDIDDDGLDDLIVGAPGYTVDFDGTSETTGAAFALESGPIADLAISANAPDPATADPAFDYTVTVTNNGPDEAPAPIVTADLPDSLQFDSATTSQGSCNHQDGTVTCELDALPMDDNAEVTLSVGAQPGVVGVSFEVADEEALDTDTSNNVASVETTVEEGEPMEGDARDVGPGDTGTEDVGTRDTGTEDASDAGSTDVAVDDVSDGTTTDISGAEHAENGDAAAATDEVEDGCSCAQSGGRGIPGGAALLFVLLAVRLTPSRSE